MDFSLILFIVLLVTGGILLLARMLNRRRRRSVIVEYARALFPIILFVFVLRSFVIEPFRIPSGSMLPGLHIGDFILVNKFKYGIRLPVVNMKVFPIDSPERGDVIVFRYPQNPKLNFIKRVVGLPGDRLSYIDKKLTINGEPVETRDDGRYAYVQDKLKGKSAGQLVETIDGDDHLIILDDQGFTRNLEEVNVPAGHYFVMGDNRDHSNDSRYWGFVPESNLVGKAFFIWFSWKSASGGGIEWDQIGNSIK